METYGKRSKTPTRQDATRSAAQSVDALRPSDKVKLALQRNGAHSTHSKGEISQWEKDEIHKLTKFYNNLSTLSKFYNNLSTLYRKSINDIKHIELTAHSAYGAALGPDNRDSSRHSACT
jgi:hypothetical protein